MMVPEYAQLYFSKAALCAANGARTPKTLSPNTKSALSPSFAAIAEDARRAAQSAPSSPARALTALTEIAAHPAANVSINASTALWYVTAM